MKKMNQKYKRMWLAGLRRKDAVQAIGQLCVAERDYSVEKSPVILTRCCLGVLKKEVTGKDDFLNNDLGRIMLKKVGITAEIQEKLVEMNDGKRWSFKKIANWIEKNL